MKLNTILTSGSWVDIADLLNDNFSKIAIAIDLGIDGDGGGGITIYDVEKYLEQYKYTTQDDVSAMLSPYVLKREVTPVITDLNTRVASIETYFSTEEESDNTINKWNEIVAFLDGIKGDTLDNILITKANKATTLAGYGITDAYTKAESDEKYLLLSSFTKDTIKSTLGISDWALASYKPTYTASEVGALGVNDTAQSALKMTPEWLTDLNSATPWRFFDMKSGYGSTDGNKPNPSWVSGMTGRVAGSSIYRWQLAMTSEIRHPYFRKEMNGIWSDWSLLAFTSDIPTKLSQLTDDVVAGNYLPIGGTAADSSKFGGMLPRYYLSAPSGDFTDFNGAHWNTIYEYRKGDGISYDNDPLGIGWATFISLRSNKGTDGLQFLAQELAGTNKLLFRCKPRRSDVGQSNKWSEVASLDSNVASATKLATPRTIWGQSFDGTKNIDLDVCIPPAHSLIIAHNEEGICIGENGVFWHNASNVWTGSLMLFTSDKVGIGVTPTEKLEVGGNLKVGGTIKLGKYSKVLEYAQGEYIDQYGSLHLINNVLSHYWGVFGADSKAILSVHGNGFVGIGTTTPSARLEVNGHIKATSVNDYEERIAALEEKTKNL